MIQNHKKAPTWSWMKPRRGGKGSVRLSRAEVELLLVLAAVQFTHIVDFIIIMPLGPQFLNQLRISPQQFGHMVSAYGFSACVSGLLAAWFIDRFDRKKSLLFLYGGVTIGTFLCTIAPNYPLLVLARIVTGFFGGIVGAAVLTIIGDVFADERRGTATGVVMSAFSLASIVGVPAGLYLAEHCHWRTALGELSGWRAPFGILGVMALVVLLLASIVLPPLRGHLATNHAADAQGVRRSSFRNVWAVLIQPSHVRAYVLMTSLVMSTFLIVPYLAMYLTLNVGLSSKQLPYVYLYGGLVTLVTMPLIGWLSDRLGKLQVFRTLALFTLIPILLVTNLPPVSLKLTVLVTILFTVTTSGRMVPVMALVTASALPRDRGSFLSVNASVQQMAMGVAPILAGLILGKTASGALTGYPVAGLLAVMMTLLSVYLAGRLHSVEREALVAVDELSPPVDTPSAAALRTHPAAPLGVKVNGSLSFATEPMNDAPPRG